MCISIHQHVHCKKMLKSSTYVRVFECSFIGNIPVHKFDFLLHVYVWISNFVLSDQYLNVVLSMYGYMHISSRISGSFFLVIYTRPFTSNSFANSISQTRRPSSGI